ncbi:hypothetical protein BE04_06980 [Sorangium cellulosum]|uniref:Secreted protein n=2 Tax=Sorangium cellulosum TaxID=56 RepID=A0A150PRX6_SORCE|nr:hypothetical protein [Sorangium cellulosum]AGP41303.1 hypothetical protein SCE1572_46510 [Sorangium cellulosum So0157-2]KYF58444.1 hypothetical protein BE04_06980 [Sorangium cellulosum]
MSTSRWLRAFALAVSAAAPLLAASSPAHAWHPPVHRSDAGVDLYLWSARDLGASTAVVPFLQFEPTPDLFINLKFPLALSLNGPGDLEDPRDGQSRAGLGNPTFTLYYADIDGKLTWYAGGRAGLPLGLVDDYDWRWATAYASAAMAYYDLHLWASDALPIGGLGGIEYRFGRSFVLRAGGDLTFFVPLQDRGRRGFIDDSDDLDVVFQAKVEPEFQSRAGFGGGVALQTVWVPSSIYDDQGQVSLLPYFVYDSQKTFFMRAGLLLALDEPLGPAFDRRRVTSLYLQFGGHID